MLDSFDARIDARVAAVREARTDWPCRRGCDLCCRRLARAPEMTAAEWARVDAAVAALPDEVRGEIRARVDALAARSGESGPVVCPYLDESRGECRIYAARPFACRTYGFYVGRDEAEHCSIIDDDLARRGDAGLVFGNAESLALDVRQELGPRIAFVDRYRA